MAAAHGLDLNTIIPSGKGIKVTKADVEAKLLGESSEKTEGKVYASPAARRTARRVCDLVLCREWVKGRIQTRRTFTSSGRIELPVETQTEEAEVIQLIGMPNNSRTDDGELQNIP
jgi:hypothetical protein